MSLLRNRLALAVALLCLELLALAVAYQFLASIECRATGAETTCRLLRSLLARAVALFAAGAIFFWARPRALTRLLGHIDAGVGGQPWLALHLAGVALLFAPLLAAGGAELGNRFDDALGPWVAGAAAASAGALFWLAPPRDWLAWLRDERFAPLAVAAVAFAIPDLADLARPAWSWPALTRATFDAVWWTLRHFSEAPVSEPNAYVIGMDGFYVHIAEPCSGVEGLALVAGFTLLYAALFRADIRFPHFWLVLPLGLALSWGFNVIRIAALVWIGARVSPDLAVNGFHSYAGWMTFTLLALGLLYGVQAVPWLRSGPRSAAPPLRDDWAAARILPFVAFMLASVVASALSPHPDLAYPLKALALAAVLAAFRRALRRLDWTPDPLALAAGALVGVGWAATQPPPGPEAAALAAALAGLGGAAFALWAAVRLLGTVLLVPLAEELFFRGYLLTRLDGGPARRAAAIAISSALFALLHGRWIAAAAAGVVFALLALRRGRLADAIAAHVAANLVVALWALARDDWSAL
jgi:exosortase E/protease (VPEID-CTERM system)